MQARLRGGRRSDPAARSRRAARFVTSGDGFTAIRPDATTSKPESVPDARDIVRDPVDANAPETGDRDDRSVALARMTTHVRAKQVATALDDDARANLQTVRDAVADDPAAEDALDRMLVEGRLSGDGQAVLEELARLTTEPLADGLERRPLVADTVQEIADPTRINQQGYGTCVPTTASIHLARNEPSEYVRLVRGLASPEGEVTLANGDRLRRDSGTIDEPDDYEGAERTQSSRLLVPALMEYGNGSLDYDAVDDSHQLDLGLFHKYVGRGLDPSGMNRIMEGMTGEEWDTELVSRREAEDITEEIAQRTRAGEDVPVALRWGDGGHAVLVFAIDDDNVHYVNPWGKEETLPREVFETHLKSRHVPA